MLKTPLDDMSEIYDYLYEQGQRTLNAFNPCKIDDGKCDRHGGKCCCGGCEHLSEQGCTTRALWCKLWLCLDKSQEYKECEIQLDKIRTAATYLGVPDGRHTKERFMYAMHHMGTQYVQKHLDKYKSISVVEMRRK
ncbi:hypothetical protein LCGC14_1305130 [marine sediment metagenome]|uniref:Uncharacterized protein n=1 Tax=marine sediment metagenome TaxID=412755 RepID=A0A0F9N585_9ZZZZ